MRLKFLTLLLLSLFSSCLPSVTFQEPQPEGSESLPKFPGKLSGRYMHEEGSVYLSISEKAILNEVYYQAKTHIDSLEKEFKIIGDSLIDLKTGDKQFIKIKDDTIFASFYLADTIFLISSENILKKFKGHYFLNKKQRDS